MPSKKKLPKKALPDHDLYYGSRGLVSSLDDAAIEQRVNSEDPTDIASPWKVSKEPLEDGSAPEVPCPDFEGHRHVILSC